MKDKMVETRNRYIIDATYTTGYMKYSGLDELMYVEGELNTPYINFDEFEDALARAIKKTKTRLRNLLLKQFVFNFVEDEPQLEVHSVLGKNAERYYIHTYKLDFPAITEEEKKEIIKLLEQDGFEVEVEIMLSENITHKRR